MHSNFEECFFVWRAVPFKWNIRVTRSNVDDFGTNHCNFLSKFYIYTNTTDIIYARHEKLINSIPGVTNFAIKFFIFPVADNMQNAFVNPCGNV